jgi:L-ascorbate metabolism protein UlaG (beta-lactamase superfamily)
MPIPRPLSRVLALAPLIALPAAARAAPAPQEPGADGATPAVEEVEITFLANAGFLLRSGRYSVLIDAFLREPYHVYDALPPQTLQDLANARPPFDGLVLALVSHAHPDHFQVRPAEKFLSHNQQAQLISSPQVLSAFKSGAQDFASVQKKLTPVRPQVGLPLPLMHEEMSVTFLNLRHAGEENQDVQNIGHLIEMGGVKILHVGDAEPTADNFAAYGLPAREIDVALVPYWYFSNEQSQRVLLEQIRPRQVITFHIPEREKQQFTTAMQENFPDVVIFQEPLEKRSFRPAGR